MSWLADWFFGNIAEDRERMNRDPGLPAYPWLATGEPTPDIEGYPYPVSFVAAATGKRYPVLINLDQMRRSVLDALAGTPDTRTPQQRRRDTWLAYLKAKERFLGTREAAQAEEDGAAAPQEPAPGPAQEGAAPRSAGPDGDGGPAGS